MKIAILDAATLGEDINLEPIRSVGQTSEYPTTAPEQVFDRLADADVAVVNKVKLNETNLKGTAVKLICVSATGYDNIDTEYCKANGIALCNVPGYSTDNVAQLTLAMALSLVTHLPEYNEYVANGSYSASGVANKLTPIYHEISSMTWGVVGGGGIGGKVAQVAEAMGCKVLMCRQKPDDRYEQVSIDELCERSDIISLHVPLNDSTRGMISRERIGKMKKNAIVINVARGAVTDEEALTEAIENQQIAGLGVDVYSVEPFPQSHPFTRILGRNNVCFTPHMAWGSSEARNRCVRVMAENMKSFWEGGNKNRIV
ncbi:MAG: hydroxyacid dehydrogenase [Clostridia bacterium]|nr:hydroxyacid dehydrogenase [Clostridia bacterium]